MVAEPLWTPTPEGASATTMARFRQFCEGRTKSPIPDSQALHAWSIADRGAFWNAVWDFFGIVGAKGARLIGAGDDFSAARFFEGATLNFAENLLARRGKGEAIVFRDESGYERRLTWRDLVDLVSRLQQAMLHLGVKPGDRVAGLLPNIPEAIAAMLAATSIGAVWSSVSPDFGVTGVLDRFTQVDPVLLISADGYRYAGKQIDLHDKVKEVAAKLPSAKAVVIIPHMGPARVAGISLADFVAPFAARKLTFEQLPFDHPLYIMFTSGTTGVPKCILHRAGGVLLQHVKEHGLHADTRAGDRVFYFTTLGWMMWNWVVSGLALGATVLLYDGSPFHPSPTVLFDFADAERMTLFGTSAKYIDTLRKSGETPATSHDLSSIRTICSTGSPLTNDGFDYVYGSIKKDVLLASISGGTDIVSCFVLGDPTRPVYRGQIQGPGLGMAVEVWRDDGSVAAPGEKGELVCTLPFPVMPLGFWNDVAGRRYHAAYFERFPNIWHQGDYAERTAEGGFVIYGRSDATLNPGGVRIGTAELYAQVEHVPEVIEALAIGQNFADDVRIVLFVRLRDGVVLSDDLVTRIKQQIRTGASPRHVPAKIINVEDIPRTKSGKIAEIAVRDTVHGWPIKNGEALANPEALKLFANIPELRV